VNQHVPEGDDLIDVADSAGQLGVEPPKLPERLTDNGELPFDRGT
jgi:hypothetical protein